MKKYRKYIIALIILTVLITTLCFIPISASKLIPAIESQVSETYGVKVVVEKLVLRLGPTLKVKTPIMHIMYEDGQKFAQLDTVKLYIPWTSVIKRQPVVKVLKAKKLTVRVNSDDKYLNQVFGSVMNKDFAELPNISLNGYSISYMNKEYNDKYTLLGQELDLRKVVGFKNFKLSTKGYFEINDKQYVNYDVSLLPKFDIEKTALNRDITDIINKVKEIDFHADLIADLKLYQLSDKIMQSSGFINIDNISVLDKTGKNPKSFAYLTLWGDKASIHSNIYTSANKKVYLEGMINNSQKPVLDLKVKTDEIDLNDLYQKLKIFADMYGLKNIDSVNGFMSANFTLKGDLNKIKSSGYMKIKNASIFASGVKIENIESDIDFSNNIINISNTVGYVNNAPILLKGSIDKNINLELLMNKVELKHLMPENFGIKSGIVSLVSSISGTIDNVIHKENLQINNLKIEKENQNLSAESIKIDTNKNNTAYFSNIVLNTKETNSIKIPSARLVIERDNIKLPETNLYMPNSKITAKGEILNYNTHDLLFNVNFEGFINSSDIKSYKNSSTKYPLILTVNGSKLLQNINAQVLLEKTDILDEPAVFNFVSKINKNSLKIEDLSIIGFSGKFSKDLKSNTKGQKKLVVTGLIEELNNPVMKNIRISIPQVLNLNICETLAQLKGEVFVNGKFDKPEIVGQLQIQNLFNQTLQFSINNGIIDFNKTISVLNAPLVKIADSTMSINASFMNDLTKAFVIKNLNIKSKYLNTDTILMYKDTPALKTVNIDVQDGKLYAERVLSEIYGSQVYLTALTGDFKLKNNVLTLKNMTSEIFNGKLAGTLIFNLKDEAFESNLMGRSVSAAPIFNIISNRKETLSGTLDFDTALKGSLTSKKTLNGDVRFEVHNGRMSTLGKLEHLLYAQNVIADSMLRTSLSVVTKAITLKDTGLFKYLRGDVNLINGIANIKMLQSQGPLMSLFIKGQYNPENDYAKLVVLGRLSDEIMTGLGAFADFSINKLMIMLTGEDNKYNISLEDLNNLPQLPIKNTKEFRSLINGIIDKPSSVIQFNWISYSQKSLRQKEVPLNNIKLPAFVEELPY